MLSFFEAEPTPLFYFLAGTFSAFVGACLWRLARFLIDIRVTRLVTEEIAEERPHDQKAEDAWLCVRASRSRLRLNPNPNPEWVGPLVDEIPRLLLEVATVYYPDHPEPLHAPRVSEFARAVQYAAMDIAEILQTRRMGRLIDVSAGHTVKAWRTGHRVWNDPKLRKARDFLQPAYKVGKPMWQVLKFKSPVTWISIAASNAAVRTIQPAIINIVARHAIDLYSGGLAVADNQPSSRSLETPETEATESSETPTVKKSRLRRAAGKLRFWRK